VNKLHNHHSYVLLLFLFLFLLLLLPMGGARIKKRPTRAQTASRSYRGRERR